MTARLPPGAPRKRAPKGSGKTRTVRYPIELTPEERAAWDAEAAARGIPLAELVRLAMAAVAPVKKER